MQLVVKIAYSFKSHPKVWIFYKVTLAKLQLKLQLNI